MKSILQQCEHTDFEYLSSVLDSYIPLTNDKKRTELLQRAVDDEEAREQLINVLDRQIRYFGSSDLAYFYRVVMNGDGGASAEDIVTDVATKLKIKLKKGGRLETKLEGLIEEVVEKELLSKSPDELAEAFKDIGMGNADIETVMEHIRKNGKVAILPVLFQVLGPTVTMGIIETIIISLIAQIIGREAAKHLLQELLKRNPWLNALGPIVWGLSAGWLAFDLQGPAFRKTIPIVLYLGVVSLRKKE